MIYVMWRKLILTLLKNNPYELIQAINKACVMTGKSQLELEKLDYPKTKAQGKCKDSIYHCIVKKCSSLGMCYDGLEVKE